jgi:hypothetical protein
MGCDNRQLYGKLHLFRGNFRGGLKRPAHFSKRFLDVLASRSASQFSQALQHQGAVTHFEDRVELAFPKFEYGEEGIAGIGKPRFEDPSGTVDAMMVFLRLAVPGISCASARNLASSASLMGGYFAFVIDDFLVTRAARTFLLVALVLPARPCRGHARRRSRDTPLYRRVPETRASKGEGAG